ncbi:type II toxin-antitoxin system ParD family antitoxin [Rhizobium sp. AG207R]|uniref:type II toxin-antitoxin system ParD family antitoxin n=1 Tax=Rhizobium sp. AG207R TaxID=2802287 RepID=UPI0022AC002F|nr:type II toxin-antitoxin system ParD family antitoxin [Rhizobium sp. AG207R]MCZ3374985.1 type II toxin-antitoxin system ParD family antitoxin [Rhizobium sp. AG207R]
MSVKVSVSISDQQDVFARKLVGEGRFSSLSAVVQHGLELVRQEAVLRAAELAALKALISERQVGDFLTLEEGRRRTQELISSKKASHGL